MTKIPFTVSARTAKLIGQENFANAEGAIVELVKNGVKIVVNSHSPYMIDALKYYADEYKINNNFYLAHKNEDETSSMIDVTMDISPIFEALTEPLRELRKMKLGLD